MSKKTTSSKIGNDSTSKKILKAIQANDGGYSLLSFVANQMEIDVQRIDVDYSGRSMYGQICTGFVCSDSTDAYTIANRVRALSAKAGHAVCASCDSMGMQFIVYCPSLGIADGEE